MAWLQRMPPGWRWALGLGLGLLSGVAVATIGSVPMLNFIAPVAAVALALAAGIVLSPWRWWAALALFDTVILAVLVAIAVIALVSPTPAGAIVEPIGLRDILGGFAWFAVFGLAPLTLVLLAGIGIGVAIDKRRGMAPEPPAVFSAGAARVARWIAALIPVMMAGMLAADSAFTQGDIASNVMGILAIGLLTATCLLAGWLLRSWWGLVAATAVYAGVAALTAYLTAQPVGAVNIPLDGFALYVILPAAVMSAIGTAIGMLTARRGGQRPEQPPQAAPAT